METFDQLTVYFLDIDQKRYMNTDYNIIVQNSYMPHCAFYSIAVFNEWMQERGLKSGDDNKIIGKYHKISLFHIEPILPDYSNFQENRTWTNEDLAKFANKNNMRFMRILDNGEYTSAYAYTDNNGEVYIYYLNCNCQREIWEYNHKD